MTFDASLGSTKVAGGSTVEARLEMGTETVPQADADGWVSVLFEEAIEDAVVVMGPVSWAHGDAATPVVRNVTETGVEFRIAEWHYMDGERARPETVSWMAASEGTHRLEDGTLVQAGLADAATGTVSDVAFDTGFETAPVLFTQAVPGSASDTPTLVSRSDAVTGEGFEVRLQTEDALGGTSASDSVAWIAVDQGESVAVSTGRTNAAFKWESTRVTEFDPGEDVFMASTQTLRDEDTATVRYTTTRDGGLNVRVHEDQSVDWNQNHRHERIGHLTAEAEAFDLFDLPEAAYSWLLAA
ncbi:MAG: hypothetical protein AAGI50_07375 [Pseudomonadota bacterium]